MDSESQASGAAVLRPFADILRDIGGGQVADDCAAQLADIVTAVQATGRRGTLTLKIEVAPMKGTQAMLTASARITTRTPEGDPVTAIFWATDDGSLVRDDPRQQALFARPLVVAEPDARLSDAR